MQIIIIKECAISIELWLKIEKLRKEYLEVLIMKENWKLELELEGKYMKLYDWKIEIRERIFGDCNYKRMYNYYNIMIENRKIKTR